MEKNIISDWLNAKYDSTCERMTDAELKHLIAETFCTFDESFANHVLDDIMYYGRLTNIISHCNEYEPKAQRIAKAVLNIESIEADRIFKVLQPYAGKCSRSDFSEFVLHVLDEYNRHRVAVDAWRTNDLATEYNKILSHLSDATALRFDVLQDRCGDGAYIDSIGIEYYDGGETRYQSVSNGWKYSVPDGHDIMFEPLTIQDIEVYGYHGAEYTVILKKGLKNEFDNIVKRMTEGLKRAVEIMPVRSRPQIEKNMANEFKALYRYLANPDRPMTFLMTAKNGKATAYTDFICRLFGVEPKKASFHRDVAAQD